MVADHDYQIRGRRRIMHAAYAKVSGERPAPALARQMMYAARPAPSRSAPASRLTDEYFTQTLLPDYIEPARVSTGMWSTTRAASPASRTRSGTVPLGTLAGPRSTLRRQRAHRQAAAHPARRRSSATPPSGRRTAMATSSSSRRRDSRRCSRRCSSPSATTSPSCRPKGMSVTAARELVDKFCAATRGGQAPALRSPRLRQVGLLDPRHADSGRPGATPSRTIIDVDRSGAAHRGRRRPGERAGLPQRQADGNAARWNLHDNGATKEEAEFLFPEDVTSR